MILSCRSRTIFFRFYKYANCISPFRKYLNTQTHIISLHLLSISLVFSFWIKMIIYVAYLGVCRTRPATNVAGKWNFATIKYDLRIWIYVKWLGATLQTEQKWWTHKVVNLKMNLFFFWVFIMADFILDKTRVFCLIYFSVNFRVSN